MLSLVVYAIGSRLKHIFRREICSIDPVSSKVLAKTSRSEERRVGKEC